VLDAIA
jgi:hypothetical protein